MSKKEEIYEFLKSNTHLQRQSAIKRVMEKFEVTETTAATYYASWRKEYMTPSIKTAADIKNSIKVDIEKAVKEAGTKITIETPKEEKIIPVNEPKKETIAKDPKGIRLIPVMFKGPVFTFSINQDGIKIIDGESELITEDIVKEQQAALEIYKDLYVGKVLKEAYHE